MGARPPGPSEPFKKLSVLAEPGQASWGDGCLSCHSGPQDVRGPPRQSVGRGPWPPGALTTDTVGGRGLTEPRQPVLPEAAADETEQSSAEPPAPFSGRKSRWVC